MILLVDAAGRPLATERGNMDGTTTRGEAGEAPSYEVEFHEVETGATARVAYNLPWGEGSEYHWTDGNMACDCNRALEFWRSSHPGAALEDEPEVACGEGRYLVTIRAGGRMVLEEKASGASGARITGKEEA